jgi:ABC-2 type transport system permease protein
LRGGQRSLATFPSSSQIGRVLGELRASLVKDFRIYLRYPSWIASEFITLPAWFLLFAIGTASWVRPGQVTATLGSSTIFNFFYWGFIFLIVFSTAIWGIGQYIRTEQLQGTIEQLFIAPVSRVTIIFGRFGRTFFTDMAIIAYTAVLLGFLGRDRVTVENPLGLALVFALLELAVLGFGLIFAAVTFRVKSFNFLANIAQFTVIGLCGVFFPLTILPYPVRLVSLGIPFTYYADLMRYTAAGVAAGTTIFDPAFEFLLAGVLSIIVFALGLAYFKATEKSAQRRGSIGTH